MKIGVIFLATAFEVRLKNKEGSFLKQHERFKMANMLDEMERWISESVFAPEMTVITCFDEIYDLCVRRHVKVVKNPFGSLSEGNMIRTGLLEMPGYEAYIVISAARYKMVNAGLLENISELFMEHSGKTVVTRYNGELTLPIVFPLKKTDMVNDMLDRNKNRLVIKTDQREMVFYDVTDEFLHAGDKDRKIKDYISGASRALTAGDSEYRVVILKGAGLLGSGIAVSLFEAGYSVVMTELEKPSTLFRNKSFAGTVYNMEKTVNGITGYLISPGLVQFEKAWKANVIPVVIDPDLEIAGLFEDTAQKGSLYEELDPSPDTQKDYFSRSMEKEDASALKKIQLCAIVDCTGKDVRVGFPELEDVTTVGQKNKEYSGNGPDNLLNVSFCSQYAVIDQNKDIKLERVDAPDNTPDKTNISIIQDDRIYTEIKSPAEGYYREIERIGDQVKKNDLIAQIAGHKSVKTDIFATCDGRITGAGMRDDLCREGDVVCIIDPCAGSAQDCNSLKPLDLLPGISLVKLLKSL